MDPGSDGVRELTTQECYQLLATARLGRLALSHRALPVVLPVSSRLHDRRIVIQITGEPILGAARKAPVVAFQTDEIEPSTYAGWSVVVTGHLRLVADAAEHALYASNLGFPRINSPHRHFVTVTPRLVSGQRRLPILGAPESSV
jgi:uncharacterized protein